MPTPKLLGIPCWIFPIFAGLAWLVTLLSLASTWVAKGEKHYPEMWPQQHLPYISNIGASDWGHPIFVAGAVLTAVSFLITFSSEKWFRHTGVLLESSGKWATRLWVVSEALTIVAITAQVLMTVFCVRRHAYTHYSMVAVFALGYILAAAFISAEKKLISNQCPSSRTLRYSFYIKLFFIAAEVFLVILGSVTMYKRMYRTAIIVEWTAATLFTFYISSFAMDFLATHFDEEDTMGAQQAVRERDEETGASRPGSVYSLKERDRRSLR